MNQSSIPSWLTAGSRGRGIPTRGTTAVAWAVLQRSSGSGGQQPPGRPRPQGASIGVRTKVKRPDDPFLHSYSLSAGHFSRPRPQSALPQPHGNRSDIEKAPQTTVWINWCSVGRAATGLEQRGRQPAGRSRQDGRSKPIWHSHSLSAVPLTIDNLAHVNHTPWRWRETAI